MACLTYHKHPDEAWPLEWFREQQVTLPSGEIVTMALAEMGSLVGTGRPLDAGGAKADGFWPSDQPDQYRL
jgi:hypothetical protein